VTVRGAMASYSWSTAHAGSAPNSLTMAGHNPFRDPTLGEKIVALVLAAWLLMTTYAFVALRRSWRAGGGLALPPSIVKRFRRTTPKRWLIGVLSCATAVVLLWSSRFLWPQERGLWRDNMRGWSGLVVSSNLPVAGFLAPAYWEIVIIDESVAPSASEPRLPDYCRAGLTVARRAPYTSGAGFDTTMAAGTA